MKLSKIVDNFTGMKQVTDLDISKIEVNRLSVMDSPDFIKWISPNEFPLTSGYLFHTENTDLIEFIKSHHAHGLIGIFIKVDRFLKELSDEVIQTANELKFPIIHVPNHYSFSDIVIPVTNQIMSEELEKVSKTNEIIREFTNLAITGDSTDKIINYLFEVLDKNVVFEDYIMDEKIASENADVESILEDEKNYDYKLRLKNSFIGKITIEAEMIHLTTQQLLAIEYAAKTLILTYKEKIALNKVEERYKEDFVTDICLGNISSLEEVQLRSKLYGLDIPERYSVIIFDIDNYKAKTIELGEASAQLKSIRRGISNTISYSLMDHEINYATYSISDSFIYIVDRDNMVDLHTHHEVLEKMAERVYDKYNFSLTIGIGQEENDILNANRSFKQARESVRISRILYGNQRVTHYNDIQPFVILNDLSKNLSSNHSILEPINQLIEYDQDNSSDFLQTLSSLIANDWSVSQFAKEEIVHYNTAKYRLQKVEEITQLDLSNPKNKFNIEFSFKLYQLRNKRMNQKY